MGAIDQSAITMAKTPAKPAPVRRAAAGMQRIVSSQHLVSDKSPELSEFEFGLIIASHAFGRWMIRCMAAAGVKDMTETEVLVLHHVNHRGREKKLADICFVLNIEDTHVVSYAMKKLARLGLVEGSRRGKEVFWSATKAGGELCERYRQAREACLLPGFSGSEEENVHFGELARLLRTLSGRYDQAARAASSI